MNLCVRVVPMSQRTALYYIARHQTEEFGVIVKYAPGEALMRRGFASEARRRPFARITGICLRLTNEGLRAIEILEGTNNDPS